MAHLHLSAVTKRFGAVEVLRAIDLEVQDGEMVVFVGPSGCGKSTLLRVIAGLERATGGDILLDGVRVNDRSAADRGLAMVFQSYALYPHMSVRQNLSFGLENGRMPKKEVAAQIDEVARMLRIEPLLDRKPRQLSGGQRQRVAIGRAIVRRPGIFLLDEPLSNLDAELRVVMRSELSALHARLGATMIYVTHDQIEAMTLAHRIVVLRDGRIEQIGTPLDLYNHPANAFVAGFIGSPRMNFLDASVDRIGDTSLGVTLGADRATRLDVPLEIAPTGLAIGDAVTLGIRPHEVVLSPASTFAVTAGQVEQLGNETIVHTAAKDDSAMLLCLAGQHGIGPGDRLGLDLEHASLHLFDPEGRRLGGQVTAPAPPRPAGGSTP
ncbi:MAG: ABC transporter ATP-binding protein [Inquilinaceae bacterium]